MSISFVQAIKSVEAGGNNVTMTNTAGNLLVVICGDDGSGTITISDTLGNIWTSLAQQSNPPHIGRAFYCQGCKAGSNTITCSVSGGSSFGQIAVAEYSGVTAFVASAKAISGTPGPSVSVTSVGTVVIGLFDDGNATWSAGSGYTARTNNSGSTRVLIEDQIASQTGTFAPGFNNGGSNVEGYTLAFSGVGPPTAGVAGLGTWQGSSFASVFSSSANPTGLDLMQVVDEGGQVVWNLNSAGASAVNPANPTNGVLIAQYFGSSLAAVFTNPLNYDLLQIKGAGGAVVFHVDFQGNPSTP